MKQNEGFEIRYENRPVREPMAAGEIIIDVTEQQRAGRCLYTDLIDTGLGQGQHLLSFQQADELGIDGEPIEGRRILYGDPQLFNQSAYIPAVPEIQMAAWLDPSKGGFRLAIRLERPVAPGEIRICWQARKEELLSEKEQAIAEAQSFYIENPPKFLRPGMKFTFSCHRSKDVAGEIQWRVIGENGGEINRFGTYTAPKSQGVFEVQAQIEGTGRKTSVYVVIKE